MSLSPPPFSSLVYHFYFHFDWVTTSLSFRGENLEQPATMSQSQSISEASVGNVANNESIDKAIARMKKTLEEEFDAMAHHYRNELNEQLSMLRSRLDKSMSEATNIVNEDLKTNIKTIARAHDRDIKEVLEGVNARSNRAICEMKTLTNQRLMTMEHILGARDKRMFETLGDIKHRHEAKTMELQTQVDLRKEDVANAFKGLCRIVDVVNSMKGQLAHQGQKMEDFEKGFKEVTAMVSQLDSRLKGMEAKMQSPSPQIGACALFNNGVEERVVKRRKIDFIGNPLVKELFHELVKMGKIKPLEGYRPQICAKWAHHEYCEYHKHSGHLTEACLDVCHIIQDLMDRGELGKNPSAFHVNASGSDDVTMVELVNDGPTRLAPRVDEGKPTSFNNMMNSCYVLTLVDIENRIRAKKGSVNLLTRTGRVYNTSPQQPPSQPQVQASTQARVTITPNNPPEDPMLVLLKKTNAQVSVWDLLVSSKIHRDTLIKALSQIPISPESTPEEVMEVMGNVQYSNVLTFTDLELPPYGSNHNDAFYICLAMGDLKIPRVLVDNGSAVNLLPEHLLQPLKMSLENVRPTTQTIRGYDSTCRPFEGRLLCLCYLGNM